MADQETTTLAQSSQICVGAISGTSMDAIDVAVLRTDGVAQVEFLGSSASSYPAALRQQLLAVAAAGKDAPARGDAQLSEAVAAAFAQAISACLTAHGIKAAAVFLVGFHGQTVWHDPANQVTCQVGDCAWLARKLGITVVGDFRQQDVAAGGQGAPLAPLYHAALVSRQQQPVVVLNLGGVGNLTYVDGAALLAFDTGPANALLDDFVQARYGKPYDQDGQLAASGSPDQQLLDEFTQDPFFALVPPKSLDRFHFHAWQQKLDALTDADGAATLLHMTAASVLASKQHLPKPPVAWLVTGGGRHNSTLMKVLTEQLQAKVVPIEDIGGRGDSLEAEAFAYLAVRSVAGLPLSLPTTTGVPEPMPGGKIYRS